MAGPGGGRPLNAKPAHTGAQVAAADPAQSVWVSANAGTGKTHVLIERILRLLLAGTAPNRILCLTFTKAAAAEVATRLSTRLGHWAAADDKTLDKDLKALLGKPAEDGEKSLARSLFARVLETTPQYWLNLQNAVDLYDARKNLAKWRPSKVHPAISAAE